MLKIAVIFDQKLYSGGGYKQSINMINLLKKFPEKKYSFTLYTTILRNKFKSKDNFLKFKYIKSSIIARLISKIRINPRYVFIKNILELLFPLNLLEKELEFDGIDLIFFITPSNLAYDLYKLNYIYTIWDLCHLDNPEFPEIRLNNQFEIREKLYSKVLKKSSFIITDCKENKKKIAKNYLVNRKKIITIPFEPSSKLTLKKNLEFESNLLKERFNKKTKYLFYPAQYWAHKNHIYILKALKILKSEEKSDVGVIFTGSDKGNLSFLKEYAFKNDLINDVIFLDFVSDNDISRIYQYAFALVMPSYFGPSNLPPLEAFNFSLPVIYPDIDEFVNQLNNTGIFVKLNDPKSLSLAVSSLLKDDLLRKKIISKGIKYISRDFKDKNFKKLQNIFDSYFAKRSCWN